MKKALTLPWVGYHFRTLIRQVFLFGPFRINKGLHSMAFRPGGAFATFLFSLFSSMAIFLPILAFVYNALMFGLVIPEMFIISAFGIAFSVIYRYAQSTSCSLIVIDRHKLSYTQFGFYEMHKEEIPFQQIRGLTLLKTNVKGTNNFKLCAVLDDNRLVLLKLTIFQNKANRLLEEYSQRLGLKIIETPSSGNPVNDSNLTLSASNT